MPDEFNEQGLSGRLKGAMFGVLVGGLIFLAGIPVLFFNEGRAVQRYRALKEGAGSVVSISADRIDPSLSGRLVHVTDLATTNEALSVGERENLEPVLAIPADAVDPANEGKLVHVSGQAATDDRIADPDFGVVAPAIRLKRIVRMYQWREIRGPSTAERREGAGEEGRIEYIYEKIWSVESIASGRFHIPSGHRNPDGLPFEDRTFATSEVRLGAFRLPPDFISEINRFEPFPLDRLPSDFPESLEKRAHIADGEIFIGDNPRQPEVGDLWISWRRVPPRVPASLVARQTGDTFAPHPGPDGREIAVFSAENRSAEALLPAGIAVPVIRLRRTVEMHQWEERETTRTVIDADGEERRETAYIYEKVWSEEPIDSIRFREAGRNNPPSMPFEGKTVTAKRVTVGDFILPERYILRIGGFEPLSADRIRAALPPDSADRVAVRGDAVYPDGNPDDPRIGDLRIRYAAVNPGPVTIVAAQAGRSFRPYESPAGGIIEEIRTGTHSADAIFGEVRKRNVTMDWLLRAGGFAVMLLGLRLVFRPLFPARKTRSFPSNIDARSPGIVALCGAAGAALIVVAMAWMFQLPSLSAGLTVAGMALFFGANRLWGAGRAG